MLDQNQLQGFQIMTSLSIIHQLSEARLASSLEVQGLTVSQFNLLNHFAVEPKREQTISQLVQVMQMNQPGITKVVNKLVQMELLSSRKDEQDGRKKWLRISERGLQSRQLAIETLGPELDKSFAGWSSQELAALQTQLSRLQNWLDTNRNE